MEKPDLSGAYALNGPDDCRRLYANWAESYETDFAQSMDYRLPAEVAAAFMRSSANEGDVLDVGAGTGLLAAALRGFGFQGAIDAVDLSAEMLATARDKGLYRDLIEADITTPLPGGNRYSGIVSSGTFTHGHVGPGALVPLLSSAEKGALVVLSVNLVVWEALDFKSAFDQLGTRIEGLSLTEVEIYGEAARAKDPAHAFDHALIVRFYAT